MRGDFVGRLGDVETLDVALAHDLGVWSADR